MDDKSLGSSSRFLSAQSLFKSVQYLWSCSLKEWKKRMATCSVYRKKETCISLLSTCRYSLDCAKHRVTHIRPTKTIVLELTRRKNMPNKMTKVSLIIILWHGKFHTLVRPCLIEERLHQVRTHLPFSNSQHQKSFQILIETTQ